jgi:hypothetical protein
LASRRFGSCLPPTGLEGFPPFIKTGNPFQPSRLDSLKNRQGFPCSHQAEGIPSGHQDCKVLMTKMNSLPVIKIVQSQLPEGIPSGSGNWTVSTTERDSLLVDHTISMAQRDSFWSSRQGIPFSHGDWNPYCYHKIPAIHLYLP